MENKNLLIGVLVVAVGGLTFLYFKKNKKDNLPLPSDAVLNSAVVPTNLIKQETPEDNQKKFKANEIADKLYNLNTRINLGSSEKLFGGGRSFSSLESEIKSRDEKQDLLRELSELGYKYEHPNKAIKK
jgi:hypothetical protein